MTHDTELNIVLENHRHLKPLSILFFLHAETNTLVIYGHHNAIYLVFTNKLEQSMGIELLIIYDNSLLYFEIN